MWYLGKFEPPPSDIAIKYKSSKRVFIFAFHGKPAQSFDVELDCLGCCGQAQWCSDSGQSSSLVVESVHISNDVWSSGGFYTPPSTFQQGRIRVSSLGSLRKSDWVEFSK